MIGETEARFTSKLLILFTHKYSTLLPDFFTIAMSWYPGTHYYLTLSKTPLPISRLGNHKKTLKIPIFPLTNPGT
ncbi:hypothetical protein SPLC1_S051810 [Arthrospira platensis C1]|nr:hypothetical protein SPLC1_S051810 [Arthrospira platensis C1]